MEFKHGSVLKVTREDTLTDIETNFLLMREAGFNTVVIWPSCFWWEEKSEEYPFKTGKRILEIAEKYGIKVIMELAGQLSNMEYAPDFLMKKEYMAIKRSGEEERWCQSFGYLNYFHPEVNDIITKHFYNTAKAYKEYPALLGYDVFNETMFRSFDDYTLKAFQKWLKDKYQTIENLNAVWERTFANFEGVGFETWKWMSVMPEVDYTLFRKDAIKIFLKNWVDAVKKADDTRLILADNIHSQVSTVSEFDRPQDDFGLKEAVDDIGMSFYPKQVYGVMENAMRNEVFDAFYTASRRQGFFISEMQTHIQALFNPTTCVKTYELKRWCLEGYSSGAKGLIYWMWRPFNKGLQTLGRGIINYKNKKTERFFTALSLNEYFTKYGALTPLKSKIGIVFDAINDDLQRSVTSPYKVDDDIYLSSIYGAYKCLFDLGVKADIVTLDEIFSYDAIILTNQLVIDKTRAEKLKEYVLKGGKLIIDGKFGVVDETSIVNANLPGGEANALTGVDFYDFSCDAKSFSYDGVKTNVYYGNDVVEINEGETVGKFDNGSPACVKVSYGNGEVLNFFTQNFYAYKKTCDKSILKVVENVVNNYNLKSYEVEGDVTVKVAKSGDKTLFFAFNYDNVDKKVKIKYLNLEFEVSVLANDSVIIEKEI